MKKYLCNHRTIPHRSSSNNFWICLLIYHLINNGIWKTNRIKLKKKKRHRKFVYQSSMIKNKKKEEILTLICLLFLFIQILSNIRLNFHWVYFSYWTAGVITLMFQCPDRSHWLKTEKINIYVTYMLNVMHFILVRSIYNVSYKKKQNN